MSSLDVQTGGDHYKNRTIQPVQFAYANNLNYFEGSVLKYITRHRQKNGKQDLEKAIHYLQMLIELEYPDNPVPTPSESPSLEYNPVIVSDYDPSIRTIALDLAPKDQPLQKASPETEAKLKAKYEFDPGLVVPSARQYVERPRVIDFPSGVYQLFGGEHQYNGEIRFIDDRGIVYLFENNLMRKVGGIGGIAYTSGVTYDYICKTIQEFNTKGQPTLAKTLVDKHQSSPENVEIIS
jgi:hypothetical protein